MGGGSEDDVVGIYEGEILGDKLKWALQEGGAAQFYINGEPMSSKDVWKIIDGELHIGSEDCISRYDFANQISDVFGLRNILIKPTESSFLNQLAERPLNSSLNCSKVKTELNIQLYPAVYGIRRVNLAI